MNTYFANASVRCLIALDGRWRKRFAAREANLVSFRKRQRALAMPLGQVVHGRGEFGPRHVLRSVSGRADRRRLDIELMTRPLGTPHLVGPADADDIQVVKRPSGRCLACARRDESTVSASSKELNGRVELPTAASGNRCALGQTTYSTASVWASRILLPLDPLDDQIGGQVDDKRDGEQHQADREQHAVMVAALIGFPQFRGDGGRQRANGVEAGLSGIRTEWPVAIRTAIVSPTARPTPNSTAANSPFLAAGNNTR